MEYSPEEVELVIAVVREWQEATRAWEAARKMWCNAPIEDEEALWKRLKAAEDELRRL